MVETKARIIEPKIKFFDLQKEIATQKELYIDKIEEVFAKGDFILGEELKQFEKEFAQYCQSKYCIGVANGTDALTLSLRMLGVEKGDEVITAANSFIATAIAAINVGATPVLVDCLSDMTIDPEAVKKSITKKTKAVIPVHLYGLPAKMDELHEVLDPHYIPIVEDACQAHGAEYKGRKAGSLSNCAAFSFYPTKNLGCFGDGGAIVTNDAELYEKAWMFRNYGQRKKYYSESIGINSRLDEIQAALLRIKLKDLDNNNHKRITAATMYQNLLSDNSHISFTQPDPDRKHIYHVFSIFSQKRNELQQSLQKHGVNTLIHYPIPIHKQECFTKNPSLIRTAHGLLVTEEACKTELSLPMHPYITEDEINHIVSAINAFWDSQ